LICSTSLESQRTKFINTVSLAERSSIPVCTAAKFLSPTSANAIALRSKPSQNCYSSTVILGAVRRVGADHWRSAKCSVTGRFGCVAGRWSLICGLLCKSWPGLRAHYCSPCDPTAAAAATMMMSTPIPFPLDSEAAPIRPGSFFKYEFVSGVCRMRNDG
jgi:hypothetical protein